MQSATQDEVRLPDELMEFIDEWRDRPGNLIMILHRTQEVYGYIPRKVAVELSRVLDIPLAKIYGVVTFYNFFKTNKPGRNRMQVCMGTACYLKGAEDIIDEVGNLLDISVGGTTDDDEFSLEAVRCVGCCGLAPVLVVNEQVYGKMTRDKLPEIIAKHRKA
ncbi:MAG: NAD(P)H-dependent oxidoreductase subunit E [Spirochaetaceae bacterium]